VPPVVLAFLGFCLVPASCTRDRIELNEPVRRAVAEAKAQGRSSAEMPMSIHPAGIGKSVSDIARDHLFLLLEAKRVGAATTSLEWIETWNVFSEIRRAPGDAGMFDKCAYLPPIHLQPGKAEFLIPFVSTGTLEVDGVTVRASSADSNINLIQGQRYLVLARQCAQGIGRIALSGNSFFLVDDSGRVLSTLGDASVGLRPFVDEILRLGSVDRVFRAVEEVRRR
jgi:hypothetical protein